MLVARPHCAADGHQPSANDRRRPTPTVPGPHPPVGHRTLDVQPATTTHRRHSPAQQRTAAELLQLANHHGRAGEDGTILIPTPLAEISARSGRGRNCGTLSRPHPSAAPGGTAPHPSGIAVRVGAERPNGPRCNGVLPAAISARLQRASDETASEISCRADARPRSHGPSAVLLLGGRFE
jgi:hypothetical protein